MLGILIFRAFLLAPSLIERLLNAGVFCLWELLARKRFAIFCSHFVNESAVRRLFL